MWFFVFLFIIFLFVFSCGIYVIIDSFMDKNYILFMFSIVSTPFLLFIIIHTVKVFS